MLIQTHTEASRNGTMSPESKSPPGSADLRILALRIDAAALKRMGDRARNQLVACMHAHNELSALNRILLFSMNPTSDGPLHDSANSIQMWCVLQLLAGKVFETWEMLNNRMLKARQEDPAVSLLSTDERLSLDWLLNYLGDRTSYKKTSIKFVRDTTAFHYAGLDFGQALNNLAPGEADIYLATHPANTLYYAGSSLVFRTLFAEIAATATNTAQMPHSDRVAKGYKVLSEDLQFANYHMHVLLYGLIKALLEQALGGPLQVDQMTEFKILGAPAPEAVGLPTWINIGGDAT
jgi:hypothetical protein